MKKILLIVGLMLGMSSALAQVQVVPAVVGGEIDMSSGSAISLNIGNTSGTGQAMSLSVGTGFSILLNRCSSTLLNNRTCTVMVGVNPATLPEGTTTVSLSNGAISLVSLKYVKATVALTSSFTVSPSALSFGTLTRAGSSAPQYLTIQNTGQTTFSPIFELSPKMAIVLHRCSSLAPGKSCTMGISMAPTTDMPNGTISNQSVVVKKSVADTGSTILASGSLNVVLSCSGLEHQENGLCVSNTRSCAISNGLGNQTFSSGSWGACLASSCNSGYELVINSCQSLAIDTEMTLIIGNVPLSRLTPILYIKPVASPITIDWGDLSPIQTVSNTAISSIPHTYAFTGEYTVKISGKWTKTTSDITSSGNILKSFKFGSEVLPQNFGFTFRFQTRLVSVTGSPVFAPNTSLSNLFNGATNFNQALSWNTVNVIDMNSMFRNASNFNSTVSFNTSNVTSMYLMFADTNQFNQPLSFNTANVTDMSSMFLRAAKFNQSLSWNTSKVTTMGSMFADAIKMNQPLNFNTVKVTDMSYMFLRATVFSQDLRGLCVPLIASEPSGFAASAPLLTQKPIWGMCPP